MAQEPSSERQTVNVNVQQSGSINIGSSVEAAYGEIVGGNITVGAGDIVGRDKIVNIYQQVTQADHSQAPLKGLGIWIWVVDKCEGGSAIRIAGRAIDTGLSHVIMKIADGIDPLIASTPRIKEIVKALAMRNIEVWGWHYVRGVDPIEEARLAAKKVRDFELAGYVAYIDSEFKKPSNDVFAEDFFKLLEELTHPLPIGLSSFHYPSFHREIPWPTLLTHVDFIMPQVFWEQAHNPGAQLARSLIEYERLTPSRPIFPLGSAYASGDWKPTAADFVEFIQTARDLGLNGADYFSWDWLGQDENRELWDVLVKMKWETVVARDVPTPSATTDSQMSQSSTPESPIPPPDFGRKYIQIIHNDEVENVEDRLGFNDYAKTFAQLINDNRTHPPLTIGISGAWGSGKSFLLHHISEMLTVEMSNSKSRVHVVKFDAWDYNASETVWPGLVRGILDELEKRAGFAKRTWSRVTRNLKRQIESTRSKWLPWAAILTAIVIALGFLTQWNWGVLIASLGAIGLTGLIANFVAIANMPMAQWVTNLFAEGRGYGSAISYMNEIRSDIQELEQSLPAGTKIVVIVDNLDRCDADKIADTLEAVKLLLNFKIFIVFLAVDSNVIARAIEKRYKELLAEAGRSGYFYLDKIIQIPFRIPEPGPEKVSRYLFGLLSAADFSSKRALPKEKARLLGDRLLKQLSASLHQMVVQLPNDPNDVQILVNDIRDLLLRNALSPYLKLEEVDKTIAAIGDRSLNEYFGSKGELDEKVLASPLLEKAGVTWAVLARWWPVSTFLMHEVMRSRPTRPKDAKQPTSILLWLLEEIEKKAAANITTQRLRDVADGPLEMLRETIKAAPVITLKELEGMLTHWRIDYALIVGFTSAELEAFQNLLLYIKKNPRHIKRMVNTFSFIRMLAAHSKDGELVLKAPETMLKWLILSSQWPLTAQVMLQHFDDERQATRPGVPIPDNDNALSRLYQKARQKIESDAELKKERSRLDDDPDILDKLVGDSLSVLTSRQLDLLRAYSINFNPAENTLLPSVAMAQPVQSTPLGNPPTDATRK